MGKPSASKPPSVLPRSSTEAAKFQASASQLPTCGSTVVMQGLTSESAAKYNGSTATVVRIVDDCTLRVIFTGDAKRKERTVGMDHVRLASDADAAAPNTVDSHSAQGGPTVTVQGPQHTNRSTASKAALVGGHTPMEAANASGSHSGPVGSDSLAIGNARTAQESASKAVPEVPSIPPPRARSGSVCAPVGYEDDAGSQPKLAQRRPNDEV